MKEIVIEVSDEGEVKLETRGFTGKACLEESRLIKSLLGKETARRITPAYFVNQQQSVKKYLNLCG